MRDRYVPVHVEYVLTEILKNSFRATVEAHYRRHGRRTTKPLPPIVATIALSSPPPASLPIPTPANPDGLISKPPSYLTIRIRDEGGGVHPGHLERIFSYAFTTAKGLEIEDSDAGGGPYAAQAVGGMGGVGGSDSGLFGEITGKGLQTGLGTIAGLGYG